MENSQIEDTDEQLRGWQNDEFKALKECFADQLVDLRKQVKVIKNPKKRKREKLWIPIELSVKIETRPEPIAYFDLHIKCSRKYPLVPPAIGFRNIKGIGRRLITKLHKQLKQETASDEHKGQGCIALLIMRAQQFLEDHYRDLELNNKSFYDQMVEQRQTFDRESELSKKVQDEMDKLERDRQVEEIRQKIIRKRELYNERKARKDSQSSNVENDVEESIYDYDGDLDADGTTASLTDEGETISRLRDLEEEEEGDTTIIDRRNTFSVANVSKSFEDRVPLTRDNSIQSRVDLEYEVLEELGHGGFGTVYKVRNRVDSRLYALKKVKLNPDNETLNERIMREVRLLSRLNHENVIRYYTAWNETETYEIPNVRRASTGIDDGESAYNSNANHESCILKQQDLSESSDDESDEVYHTSYLINDKNLRLAGENSASYVVFDTSDNKDENEIVESMKKALGPKLSDDDGSDVEVDQKRAGNNPIKRLKINRWLYIQMELGQGTLREAIDGGLPRNKDRARRFFREILDGLCHIHRQGIIHRDLKPVNIFLDSMDRPKIGDFGLATTNLFIVTQNHSPGVHTATAIKPNRMSLEKLKLLATPELGGAGDQSNGQDGSRSAELLKYVHYNQTDNIGTPLYMSPELSATNSATRIAKVVYSHKVDVYSLGIIYFEMLYPFATGHERIIILQDLRKKSIKMPADVDDHLSKEDIELIKLLLTHDVAARPTSEKLLTSNLLPSVGLKEREAQNMIKQVVQNRQARTHKLMLRLLFEQNDSYVDDFVFDFEDVDIPGSSSATPTKSEAQQMLKDFNTKAIILDQVKVRLELLLKSRGFIQYSTPTLMPKYSASKYYSRQQIDDVVMLMDKNSSILTLPYDLRLPFARNIARTNINYMNRYSIEKIFRQRQILGYHPDQLWECCLDIVTPPLPQGLLLQSADAEILNLMGDVIRNLPMLYNLQPSIKLNDIRLVRKLIELVLQLNTINGGGSLKNNTQSPSSSSSTATSASNSNQNDLIDSILSCISESLNISLKKTQVQTANTGQQQQAHSNATSSLPAHIKEDLKRDLLANKLLINTNNANMLISFLDALACYPHDLYSIYDQLVNRFSSRPVYSLPTISAIMKDIKKLMESMDHLVTYANGLGLDLPLRISAGFVLNALRPVNFYSGMVCLLECRRYSKAKLSNKAVSNQHKGVILAVGGRYDSLIEKFSRNRYEVFDKMRSSDPSASPTDGSAGPNLSGNLTTDSRENCSKAAVGVSFEVEKFARFVLEDYVEKFVSNRDQMINMPTIQQLVRLNFSQGAAANATQWPTMQSTSLQLNSTQNSLQSPNLLLQNSLNLDSSNSSISQHQQHQQQFSSHHSPAGTSNNFSLQTPSLNSNGLCLHHTNFGLCVRYWSIDLAICTLSHPKTKPQITVISNMIKQIREKGIICNEYIPQDTNSFTMNSLTLLCKENRIPYVLAVKFVQQHETTNSTQSLSVPASSYLDDNNSSQASSTSQHSQVSPMSSPTIKSNTHQLPSIAPPTVTCYVTLYQWEKVGRLKQIKHYEDAQSMINYLVKRY